MPRVLDATPQISVLLYKTISRSTVDGQTPVSGRYQGRSDFIDLTPYLGDGSSVRTTKSVREPAGAFSITLSDKPNTVGMATDLGPTVAIESIYGVVEPMDIVEIRMWSGLGPKPDILPIKMRGFVSDIQRQQTMGQDGRPVRQVVISGQDYGKIWQNYQVIYLQAYSEGIPLLTTYALNELFGIGVVNAMPAGELVRTMIQKVINPYINAFMPENSEMPREIQAGDSISVRHGNANLSYQEAQGSIYDFLKGHTDVGSWNELYIEDREDGVYVVYRPIPALRLSGDGKDRKIMPDAPDPIFVDIEDSLVASISVARGDNSISNFFWVTSPRFDLISDIQRKLASIPADDGTVTLKDYPNAAIKYYGARAMYAETQLGEDTVTNMLSGENKTNTVARIDRQMDWIERRRVQLMDMHRDTVVMERGTARVKGGPTRPDGSSMKAGDYARFNFGGIESEAYVVQIDDEFTPYQGYTTTLTFERGTGFARRIQMESGRQTPWLAEQSTRKLEDA